MIQRTDCSAFQDLQSLPGFESGRAPVAAMPSSRLAAVFSRDDGISHKGLFLPPIPSRVQLAVWLENDGWARAYSSSSKLTGLVR